MFQVSPYRRVNMTYALYVYEGANVVLPTATVEFRQRLDQSGEHMPGDNCPASFLVSNTRTIWGQLTANSAHLLIGTGEYIQEKQTLLKALHQFQFTKISGLGRVRIFMQLCLLWMLVNSYYSIVVINPRSNYVMSNLRHILSISFYAVPTHTCV